MTKEEIIATAIHEAFRCGKEAGEEAQRMYAKMQNEIDYAAKQVKPDELRKKLEDTEAALSALYAEYMGSKEHELHLSEENKTLLASNEEKDATIIELRTELQANKDADTLLCDENKRLLESLKEKDAIIAELRAQNDKLYAYVNPLAIIKPQGEEVPAEPSPCIDFSAGDQVLVSGAYFGENIPDHHGVILEVMKDIARVLITEKDSDYEDDEYCILYEYLKKI